MKKTNYAAHFLKAIIWFPACMGMCVFAQSVTDPSCRNESNKHSLQDTSDKDCPKPEIKCTKEEVVITQRYSRNVQFTINDVLVAVLPIKGSYSLKIARNGKASHSCFYVAEQPQKTSYQIKSSDADFKIKWDGVFEFFIEPTASPKIDSLCITSNGKDKNGTEAFQVSYYVDYRLFFGYKLERPIDDFCFKINDAVITRATDNELGQVKKVTDICVCGSPFERVTLEYSVAAE